MYNVNFWHLSKICISDEGIINIFECNNKTKEIIIVYTIYTDGLFLFSHAEATHRAKFNLSAN